MANKKLLLRFDRALSNSLIKQIGILLCFLFVALSVSYLLLSFSKSDWIAYCQDNDIKPWLLPVFLLIDSNALNSLYIKGGVHGWMLFASSLTFIFSVVIFNGMLVGVIVNAIGNRVVRYHNGLTHYLKEGHYVIMGYDDLVPSIIEDVFERDPNAYVLLLTAFDAKQINEKLKKSVAKKQLNQIIINYGQRTASEYYPDIHLESAKEIYIVGRRSQAYHDAVNIECIDSICSYLKEHPSPKMPVRITCVFEDLDTYAAFKTSELFDEVSSLGISFVPHNFYASWAKQVFINRTYKEKNNPEPISYPSVYGGGIGPEDKKYMHLVFVGTTNFAVSFAMEAASTLHFPNFNQNNQQYKTRITFIEKNMEDEMPLFITRSRHYFEVQSYWYRDLSKDSADTEAVKRTDYQSKKIDKHDFLDVEFEFINGDIYSPKVQDLIREWATDRDNQYLSIFLSLADQRFNFMMGMNMPDEVYENDIPVFIRQNRADNFVTNLRKADSKSYDFYKVENDALIPGKRMRRYAHLYPFGMEDLANISDECAARQAKLFNYLYATADYETNTFTDLLVLNTTPKARIWSDADAYWNNLSVAKKWSNFYCAFSIPCKLAALRKIRGLKPDDTSFDQEPLNEKEYKTIAQIEHNRWNLEKLFMGFRKPSQSEDCNAKDNAQHKDKLKKNKDLFVHSDIMPFDDLPQTSKKLNYELARYIPWILKMTETIN